MGTKVISTLRNKLWIQERILKQLTLQEVIIIPAGTEAIGLDAAFERLLAADEGESHLP